MKWLDGHEAFMQGFKDGYLGVDDTVVDNFNQQYELGFITGSVERKRKNNPLPEGVVT